MQPPHLNSRKINQVIFCKHTGSQGRRERLRARSIRQAAMFHAALEAEGKEIMMHPHSPSPPQLAIPGIGFPQNFSVAQDVLDSRAFRDWSDDRFDAPPQPIDRIAWRASP